MTLNTQLIKIMNNKRNNRSKHQNPYNILPPSKILDEYEDIAPGSVDKLLEMAAQEQEHRHVWQEEHLKVHSRIYKWGQIFAFAYNILLLLLIGVLIKDGNSELAVKLFTINAALMTFALLLTFVERRIMNRRAPRRFNKNQGQKHSGNSNHSNKRKH